MIKHGRNRAVIEKVMPEINKGLFSARAFPGESIHVEAHAYADGHDEITVMLYYRHESSKQWESSGMSLRWNDEWTGSFKAEKEGRYIYRVSAWVDGYKTWKNGLLKKAGAGQALEVEFKIGAEILKGIIKRVQVKKDIEELEKAFAAFLKGGSSALEFVNSGVIEAISVKYPDPELVSDYDRELRVNVEPPRTGFSAWYEIFPRSCAKEEGVHGTFKDAEAWLPVIKELGFDVVYFPPIHPIGVKGRKGRNNTLKPAPGDPGSPWAVQNHKEIHPQLGTTVDFEEFVKAAKKLRIDTALDIAFQCSPDHVYITEHPEWFKWRTDGTIQYAENPPKKYEDIVPFNFENDNWQELWDELVSVFIFWAEKGVRIFRVDNPHTKPFGFWEYALKKVKERYPGTIFLAEAFTRPKIMHMLAKTGFNQSYTYFTWRNTKQEIEGYVNELVHAESRWFFTPNFWPNTPDILHEYLQKGGRPAHVIRLVLAATLSSNYGIYGGAFITIDNEPFPGKEENNNNEKYQLKNWDLRQEGSIFDEVKRINAIRRENPALQTTWNTRFYYASNDNVIFYIKADEEKKNIIMTAVNLDPHNKQAAVVHVPAAD
ncbi:MAG TPA: alpha-1,4-glucan--maltose-1-phosphate maltosyltransferase, partial [bacterium]|nr:alpha-1,4-glucan--maltose-1-phosphate maltosyltransferase [bacterium]